jgi:hypothetical protein
MVLALSACASIATDPACDHPGDTEEGYLARQIMENLGAAPRPECDVATATPREPLQTPTTLDLPPPQQPPPAP